jgi:hypothetical protein
VRPVQGSLIQASINNGGTVSISAKNAATNSLNLGSAGSGASGTAQVSAGTLTANAISLGSAGGGIGSFSQTVGMVTRWSMVPFRRRCPDA